MARSGLAVLLLSVLPSCSSTTVPVTDAGFPIRFDTSKWTGVVDDATLSWLIELRKAQLGESADLDGDGVRELLVTHTAQGTTRWVSQPFQVEFRVEQFPDGRRVHELNYENAGYFAEKAEFGVLPFQAVFSYDKDTNNKIERRITRSLELDGGLLWVEEVDAKETGVWVESQRWATPQWADQSGSGGDGCEGTANMPDGKAGFGENVPAINILETGEAGCNFQRKLKLGVALNCFRERLKCLDKMNPTLRNNIASHLVSDPWAMGCSNTCTGRAASTLPRVGSLPAKTNFAPSFIDTASQKDLCAVLMHESMHMAEVGYNPVDHDKNNDDVIYSCARYCAGCSTRSPRQPPPTPNQDCAACAANASKARVCGEKKQWQTISYTYGTCAGGFVNPLCSDWKAPVRTDCNGKNPVEDAAAGCCNMCPANSNNTIKPCTNVQMPMSDSCNMTAPECL